MMKKDTVKQGERSEMIFAHKCMIEHGYSVSTPFTTEDYDLIVDVNNKLYKVQVKSSIKGNGNVNNNIICLGFIFIIFICNIIIKIFIFTGFIKKIRC